MKKILKIILLPLIIVVLSVSVSAKEPIDEIKEEIVLPNPESEIINNYEITYENIPQKLTAENFISVFVTLVKEGIKPPLAALTVFIATIFITSALKDFLLNKKDIVKFITVAIMASVLLPLYSTFVAVKQSAEHLSTFMLSFLPAYFVIAAAGGNTAAVSAVSPTMLLAANGTAYFTSHVILPLISAYLGVTVAFCVTENEGIKNTASAINKISLSVGGIVLSAFTFLLNFGGRAGAAADTLAVKTAKTFLAGIPMVGNTIGESINYTREALTFLKTGVGIYGVISVAAIILPPVITLLLWKGAVYLGGLLASFMGENNISHALSSINGIISTVIGITVFISMLFIIGLSVLVRVSGGA